MLGLYKQKKNPKGDIEELEERKGSCCGFGALGLEGSYGFRVLGFWVLGL